VQEPVPQLVRAFAVRENVDGIDRSKGCAYRHLARAQVRVEYVAHRANRVDIAYEPTLLSRLERRSSVQWKVVRRIAARHARKRWGHLFLDVQESHVSERGMIAILLPPVENVAGLGNRVYTATEKL